MRHRKSHPGRAIIHIIASILLTFILSGCGSSQYQHGTGVYLIHTQPEQPSEETATILMADKYNIGDFVDWVTIGDTRIEHKRYGTIIINSGPYSLKWGRKFSISPFLKRSGVEKRNWSTDVTLDAGHVYVIHAKRTLGHGYKIYSWITDETSGGEILWGKKYIPEPYDYMLIQ